MDHSTAFNHSTTFNHSTAGAITIFNNTWGHLAPKKNVSYSGTVRFTLTDHSQYGCQPIVITYDLPESPYMHDKLFRDVCDWNTDDLETGCIYERKITFRNYRLYYCKIIKIL